MARIVGMILGSTETKQGQEKHICPHCGKAYKSEAALEKHVQQVHQHASGEE